PGGKGRGLARTRHALQPDRRERGSGRQGPHPHRSGRAGRAALRVRGALSDMETVSAQSPAVRVEREGAVGWVVLNRPEQINAINDDIRRGVPAALAELDSDPEVRVIVIRGEGPRGFCAGADIKERRGPETSVQVRRRMENARWIEAHDRTGKPVVAAIHGYCMGGGLELALACDIRYVAPDAVLALPETGLGLIPGG